MSDLEKLKALLTEFGVGFECCVSSTGFPYISCCEGSAKVSGYHLFRTEFDFDKDGKFVEMGAWE